MKVVSGRWLGRFICAQCDEPSYLDAVVVLDEIPVCWDCVCNAAAEAQADRRQQALAASLVTDASTAAPEALGGASSTPPPCPSSRTSSEV